MKNVGVSNHNLSEIKRANEILGEQGFRISAVQNHFSLLNRSSESSGILDYCRENDITFFAYMVLEQGALYANTIPGTLSRKALTVPGSIILCWPSWKSLRQPWEKSVKSMACPQHKWERIGPYPKEFFPSLA